MASKMKSKLTEAEMDVLEIMIGSGPKTFTLLYSITRDGCDAKTFHQKCDNQGPTITVLYNPQGSIYGGYAGLNLPTHGTWANDPKSFLFQLKFSGKKKEMRFNNKNFAYSYYGHNKHGTYFGNGDLITFSGTINPSKGVFVLNGSSAIGNTYDNHGLQAADIKNGNLNVTELEVYKVTDGARRIVLPKPWRRTPDWNEKFLCELTEEMENMSPVIETLNAYRILLLGPVGSGKSSFCNTLTSVFRGRITHRAICGSGNRCTTTLYQPYNIRTRQGSDLKMLICDTRGLEEHPGIGPIDVSFLVDGHVPDMYEFNPEIPIDLSVPELQLKPSLSQKVHCVAFTLDAASLDDTPSNVMTKIIDIMNICKRKQIPQAILLTKIDTIDESVDESLEQTFDSWKIHEYVKKASKLLGLPENHVIPVKNYNRESMVDEYVNILALLALRQIVYFVEDHLENVHMTESISVRLMQTANSVSGNRTDSGGLDSASETI